MITTTLPQNPGPLMMTLPLPSPAEFLKSLPASFREAVLAELLLAKWQEMSEDQAIAFQTSDGKQLGLFLRSDSTSSAADVMYAQLDPITRANLLKPYVDFDWDNCATEEEMASVGRG